MKTLGKQNLGIVGFSYEITNSTSTSPWITKRELGRKTSQKVEVAHGSNWSEEYWNWLTGAYGHSHIYLDDRGPFYSIVGGYTDYTSNDSKAPSVKSDEWGVETGDKFCIREGYAWNRFLNKEGYSRSYIYLIQKEGINNFAGSRIRSTSKDSSQPWIETNFFGERTGKEIYLTGSYGWSQQYGNGYNHFSLYVDEALKLDNKDAFWGKINEIERERENAKKEQVRQEVLTVTVTVVNTHWVNGSTDNRINNQDQFAVLGADWETNLRSLTTIEQIYSERDRLKGLIDAAKVAEREAARKTEQDLKNSQAELERIKKQNEFLLKQLEEQSTSSQVGEQRGQVQQNPPFNPNK